MPPKNSLHKRYLLFTVLLHIGSLNILFSQPAHFHHYTVEDGLTSDAVYGAMQDREGYIWIYTEKGISKFDGYEFKNFGVQIRNLTTPPLMPNYTDSTIQVTLLPAPGFVELDNQLNVIDMFGVPSLNQNRIFKDKEKNIWFTQGEGIYLITAQSLNAENFEKIENNRIIRLDGNKRGDVFGSTSNGNAFSIEKNKINYLFPQNKIGQQVNGLA